MALAAVVSMSNSIVKTCKHRLLPAVTAASLSLWSTCSNACDTAQTSTEQRLTVGICWSFCTRITQELCIITACKDELYKAHLKQVEELKCFHLKAKAAIHHEQDQVSILGSINHAMQTLQASKTCFGPVGRNPANQASNDAVMTVQSSLTMSQVRLHSSFRLCTAWCIDGISTPVPIRHRARTEAAACIGLYEPAGGMSDDCRNCNVEVWSVTGQQQYA